jgi:endonuclease/exonuclease/phosphatase family metal-dependent hydrolase
MPDRLVTVMTQNLYIGGDILAPLDDLDNFEELALRTLRMMIESRFPERAGSLARIIAGRKPDIIGLQEVCTIALDFPGLPHQFNQTIHSRQILLDALSALDADYRVAAVVENSDISISLPSFGGSVGIVDSDVVLVGRDVNAANPEGRNYAENREVCLGKQCSFVLRRGFAAIDVAVKGKTLRFVSTHLENPEPQTPQGDKIQLKQTGELLAHLASEVLPIVLVGDFNAAPDDSLSAYTMIKNAGYTDVWLRESNGPGTEGFTCCQDPELRNAESMLSKRIDHIFVSDKTGSPSSSATDSAEVFLVGNHEEDKTPSGRWPSDHAGLFARLSL